MRYLLDTHTFLWITKDDPLLSQKVIDIFLDSRNVLFLSLASVWEIALKLSIGRLRIDQQLDQFIVEQTSLNQIQLLPVKLKHITEVTVLPFHHRDPFDRLLVTQCQVENLSLLSRDKAFSYYDIEVIW